MTALAGESFVAAELLKRGLQCSVTFGTAKSIDLLAHNPRTEKNFNIQVKALYAKNYFLISPRAVKRGHVYVFVLLNNPGKPVEYFILPSSELLEGAEQFGKNYQHPTLPGIHPKSLQAFRDNWQLFGVPGSAGLQPAHCPTFHLYP